MTAPVDPSLELQIALIARLRAFPALATLVGGRIYDAPPPSAAYPYVTLGEDQILPDAGTDYDGADVTLTLHVWSKATGFPETKRIAAAIRAALAAELPLTALRLVDLVYEGARYLREPDGLVSHGVVTFTALTEPV